MGSKGTYSIIGKLVIVQLTMMSKKSRGESRRAEGGVGLVKELIGTAMSGLPNGGAWINLSSYLGELDFSG